MTSVDSATNHWLLVYNVCEAAAALLQVPGFLARLTASHSYGVLLHRSVRGTHHICLWTNFQRDAEVSGWILYQCWPCWSDVSYGKGSWTFPRRFRCR